MCCVCDASELEAQTAYKILVSMKSIVGVRFSISKTIFSQSQGYDEMTEERYLARITRFANTKTRTISVIWEADELTDVYPLHQLLIPAYALRFERMVNGGAPPKLTGRALAEEQVAARKRAATAAREDEGDGAEPPALVDIPWVDGAVHKVQQWTVLEPEGIAVDERAAAGHLEYSMKLKRVLPNPDPATLRTGYQFLFLWSVPPAFLDELMAFMNERLSLMSKKACTRPVTKGGLELCAICLTTSP